VLLLTNSKTKAMFDILKKLYPFVAVTASPGNSVLPFELVTEHRFF